MRMMSFALSLCECKLFEAFLYQSKSNQALGNYTKLIPAEQRSSIGARIYK